MKKRNYREINKDKAQKIISFLRAKREIHRRLGHSLSVRQINAEIKEVKDRLKFVNECGYKF